MARGQLASSQAVVFGFGNTESSRKTIAQQNVSRLLHTCSSVFKKINSPNDGVPLTCLISFPHHFHVCQNLRETLGGSNPRVMGPLEEAGGGRVGFCQLTPC